MYQYRSQNSRNEIRSVKEVVYYAQSTNLFGTILGFYIASDELKKYPKITRRFAIIIIPVLVFLIITKILIFYLKLKKKITLTQQYNRDLLVGYGGISICGYVLLSIGLCDVEKSIMLQSMFICNSISGALFILFVVPNSDYKVSNSPLRPALYRIIFWFLHVGLLVGIVLYLKKHSTPLHWNYAAVYSAINFGIFATSKAEFIAILINGVREVPGSVSLPTVENGIPTKVITVKYDTLKINMCPDSSQIDTECSICLNDYSNLVIPRVLVTCGHTVCEECIGKLKGSFNKVACPFCRRSTELPAGDARRLPENHTALELSTS